MRFANGDLKDVASVDPATNTVMFTDGMTLPSEFKAWSYGHALTVAGQHRGGGAPGSRGSG